MKQFDFVVQANTKKKMTPLRSDACANFSGNSRKTSDAAGKYDEEVSK